MFIFQWVIYITICIISLIVLLQPFTKIKMFLEQKEFKTQIVRPLTHVIMAASYVTFDNLDKLYESENDEVIRSYLLDQFDVWYDLMRFYINRESDRQVEDGNVYQRNLHQKKVDLHVNQLYTNQLQTVTILEGLKKYLFQTYKVRQDIRTQSTFVNYGSNDNYIFYSNLIQVSESFRFLEQSIAEEQVKLYDSIKQENLIIFLISITFLILSFLLLIPSIQKYKLKLEGISKLIARITEKEADQQIFGLQLAHTFVNSPNEQYLTMQFLTSIYEANAETQKISSIQDQDLDKIQKKFSKGKKSIFHQKKKQNSSNAQQYLIDRIQYIKINLVLFISLVVLLFVISFTMFLVIYVLYQSVEDQLYNLLKMYGRSNDNIWYIDASLVDNDMIFMDNYCKANGISYIDQATRDEFQQLIHDNIIKSGDYFTTNLIQLSLDDQFSDEYKRRTSELAVGQCCLSEYLTPVEQKLCMQVQNGVINTGLSNVMKTVLQEMFSRDYSTFNVENYLSQSDNYQSDIMQWQLIVKLIWHLQNNFFNEINRIIDQRKFEIQVISISGASFYTLIFLTILIYTFKKCYSDYNKIKKALLFIPFTRINSDPTTVYLLKKLLDY